MNIDTICHGDGRISYYSVIKKQRQVHARHITEQEMAALTNRERERLERHFDRHGWEPTKRRLDLNGCRLVPIAWSLP